MACAAIVEVIVISHKAFFRLLGTCRILVVLSHYADVRLHFSSMRQAILRESSGDRTVAVIKSLETGERNRFLNMKFVDTLFDHGASTNALKVGGDPLGDQNELYSVVLSPSCTCRETACAFSLRLSLIP